MAVDSVMVCAVRAHLGRAIGSAHSRRNKEMYLSNNKWTVCCQPQPYALVTSHTRVTTYPLGDRSFWSCFWHTQVMTCIVISRHVNFIHACVCTAHSVLTAVVQSTHVRLWNDRNSIPINDDFGSFFQFSLIRLNKNLNTYIILMDDGRMVEY